MIDQQMENKIYTYRHEIHRSTNGDFLKSQHLDKRVLVNENQPIDASFIAVAGESVVSDDGDDTPASAKALNYRILAAAAADSTTPDAKQQTAAKAAVTDSSESTSQTKSAETTSKTTAKNAATTDNKATAATQQVHIKHNNLRYKEKKKKV